ncbi:hypothetical protein ANSO36C_47220 [Nostoc cf. commune SO-36]|uniref:Uncharacterized protein n=1 Tax=Nostoc cf. commune SO-36 TaxID=449208 RepID=A0ABN6Q8S6_NOSCO|nr:hypothetical protein [Nostoc commune]BDI18920.1 hypothetical protein ANSO36C_47220 [Nostoc cf. commune SO-36]
MRFNINNFKMQLPQYGQKLAIASGLLLSLCLGGCGATSNSQPQLSSNPGTTTTKLDKKVVLTTFTVIADMAQNVAGDKAIVESITKPGQKFMVTNQLLAIW